MEEIASDLEELEMKQSNAGKAFENFHSRCKGLGDHFNLTRNSLRTRLRELQTRDEEIGLREKQLEEKESYFKSLKEEELDAIEEVITEKLLEIEQGKTHLQSIKLLVEEKSRELDSKEKRFLEVGKLLREKERECDLIQNRIEVGTKNLSRMEESIGEMNLKVKAFSLHKKSMENWCCKLDLKEREVEGLSEKLALKEELFEPNIEELHFIAKRVKKCLNEVQRKERQVESKAEELKLTDMRVNERVNKVQSKEKHFDSMEKSVEEEKQRLDLLLKSTEKRVKHLDSLQKLVEEREKDLDSLSHELERKGRLLELQAKDLELKQTQFEFQEKTEQSEYDSGANNVAVPLSVSNISSVPVKIEEPDTFLARNSATFLCSNLQPNSTKDERNVPGFPDDKLSGNHLLQNELATSLRSVPDPAKLVLNNMQKSLARYLRNGDFEESIMSINISILKELLSVSPHVGSHLKADATTLAAQWKEKMNGNTVNSVESLAFVLFIATYGLVSTLNGDEVVKLLGLISQNKRALELCQTHGFAAKIADLIRNLIERKQLPEAVIFICTFKLIDKLPPTPLLKEYVEDAKRYFEVLCRMSISLDEKVKAVDNLMVNLRAVRQCIKDYDLESKYSSADIEMQVVQLEKMKENWSLVPPLSSNVDKKEQRKRKEPDTFSRS